MNQLVVGLAMAAVAAAGCKGKAPRERALAAAAAKDFWPDAPPVTRTDGRSTLRYQPERITGYRLSIDVETPPGSKASFSATMALGMTFGPGPTPRSRSARITELGMSADMMGQGMNLKLEGDELTMREGGETIRFKRGEGGPLDVDKFLDLPFTTLTLGDDGTVRFEGNPDHPITALGGDMMDSSLILSPDLPTAEIPVGHEWTVERNVALGGVKGRIDVRYRFRYLGDGTCPSGAASCAILGFDAESSRGTAESEAGTVTVTYAYAGKVYLDHAKGTIDESRAYMQMDAKVKDLALTFGGTFTLKPSA